MPGLEPHPLTADAIAARLTTHQLGRPLHVYESVASTNDVARELAQRGALEGTTVVAVVQTSGRGRRGRAWVSPAGGLWLSVILQPVLAIGQWPLVGLAAALGAAVAIEELAGLPVHVKWPNDVMAADRKLGGVLVEANDTGAIAGIGINANLSVGDLAPVPGAVATSLLVLLGYAVDLATLAASVLAQFERQYDDLQQVQATLLARWRARDITLGRPVHILGAQHLEGTAEDVDDSGALLVRTATGLQRVVAGDVSLRMTGTPQE